MLWNGWVNWENEWWTIDSSGREGGGEGKKIWKFSGWGFLVSLAHSEAILKPTSPSPHPNSQHIFVSTSSSYIFYTLGTNSQSNKSKLLIKPTSISSSSLILSPKPYTTYQSQPCSPLLPKPPLSRSTSRPIPRFTTSSTSLATRPTSCAASAKPASTKQVRSTRSSANAVTESAGGAWMGAWMGKIEGWFLWTTAESLSRDFWERKERRKWWDGKYVFANNFFQGVCYQNQHAKLKLKRLDPNLKIQMTFSPRVVE